MICLARIAAPLSAGQRLSANYYMNTTLTAAQRKREKAASTTAMPPATKVPSHFLYSQLSESSSTAKPYTALLYLGDLMLSGKAVTILH